VIADSQGNTPPISGTVTFTDDGTVIAGCAGLAVDAEGSATCTEMSTARSPRTHHIEATYSGDDAYQGSEGELTYRVK